MQRKRQLRSTGLLCCLLLFTAVMAGAEEVTLTSGSTGNINANPIKITAAGTYTIEGTGTTTTNAITVELSSATDVANITIKNVHIERTGDFECSFDIAKGTVNLTLEGENILKAGYYKAGLQVANDSKLVITQGSTGKLTAQGRSWGAGIGGGNYGTGGTITIEGGTVMAQGGGSAAGIGGGSSGSGGTITIEGGTVMAQGGGSAAGIGGGLNGTGGAITIKGGTVTAQGGSYAASIGGGNGGSSGTIIIEGGTVTAKGGFGIGDGSNGSGGTVTITGGIIDTPSLSSGACRILGGTLVCRTIPVTAEITGASVRTGEAYMLEDGKSLAVIKGLPKNKKVASVTIGSETATVKDMYTDASGMLYLYLPTDNFVALSLTMEGGGSEVYEAVYLTTSEVYDKDHPEKNASFVRLSGSSTPVLSRDQNGGSIQLASGSWNDTPAVGSTVRVKVEANLGFFLNYEKLKGISKDELTVQFIGKNNNKLTYILSFTMPSHDVCISLFDKLSVTPAPSDDSYELTANQLTIKKGGEYSLKGVLGVLSDEEKANYNSIKDIKAPISIVVADNISGMVTLHLDRVSLKGYAYGMPGLACGENNTVKIVLDGENYLEGNSAAGINKGPDNGTLTIGGDGMLNAQGNDSGAGIGGTNNQQAKNITIEGGTIGALGYNGAPGIGSGAYTTAATNIAITGGSVQAETVQGLTGKKRTQITIPAMPGGKVVQVSGLSGYKIEGMNLYSSPTVNLFLWLPNNFDASVTINGYTGTVKAGNTVDLTSSVTIISSDVSYNANTHKDKSIKITSGGTFTVNTSDASVIDLTVEDGGKLLTTQQLAVKNSFSVQRLVKNKWMTFCSPVALTLGYNTWATSSNGFYFLKGGYSSADDQQWTLKQGIEANTPYLLSCYYSSETMTFYAQGVTLPTATTPSVTTPSGLDNYLLFRANPSLSVQKLTNIYVLDINNQEVVLKTDEYELQPFEAFFVASPAMQERFKRFSLADGSGEPTGIAEVLKGDFHVSSAQGSLLIDNRGEADEVAVYSLTGTCLFRRSHFTGQHRIDGLPHGVYIVTYKQTAQKVICR